MEKLPYILCTGQSYFTLNYKQYKCFFLVHPKYNRDNDSRINRDLTVIGVSYGKLLYNIIVPIIFGAVSYTHLDVYKRQGLAYIWSYVHVLPALNS